MGDVVNFPGVTRLDLPVERIIKAASDNDLTEIVIVGYNKNGEFYFASSKANGSDVLWLLEGAKAKLIQIGFFND